MTKIKDLVTVTCDNAFLQFPIDSERYELLIGVEDLLHWYDNCRIGGRGSFRNMDEKVHAFLEATMENFLQGALSWVQLDQYAEWGGKVPSIVADRARRCEASLVNMQRLDLCRIIDAEDRVGFLMETLWGNLYLSLSGSTWSRKSSSNGQEVST